VTCNVSDDKGALDVVKDNDLVMTVEMWEQFICSRVAYITLRGFRLHRLCSP
jgi:hypothetical protein